MGSFTSWEAPLTQCFHTLNRELRWHLKMLQCSGRYSTRSSIRLSFLMFSRITNASANHVRRALRSRSQAMHDVYEFDDGPLQQERDRQLQNHAPFDRYPDFLSDPVLQRSMFNYNAIDEAEKAWNIT
ncbi:hypothetical protein N7G274_006193 [Stereocaulon virgatum]|uniref:Uncharacterized protein n=1 Tax=Stereocaulon virgatum TaxID=373712 RepID=A0ABR4A6D3_9LECA